MTYLELNRRGRELLRSQEIEDADIDARELLLHASGLSRTQLSMAFQSTVPHETVEIYRLFLQRRLDGEPLQYLLGEWEFYGLPFFVGEGVLIPRPETELLVDEAVRYVKAFAENHDRPAEVLDLCAASGCIGLTVAHLAKNSRVTGLEKSDQAFSYLLRNQDLIETGGRYTAEQGNLFDGPGNRQFDLILSNPPYVRSDDIRTLSREVQREPQMALDGGEDGLIFYRAIAEQWLPVLRRGGMAAVECGEDQTEEVASLFRSVSSNIRIYQDYAGLPRGVVLYK